MQEENKSSLPRGIASESPGLHAVLLNHPPATPKLHGNVSGGGLSNLRPASCAWIDYTHLVAILETCLSKEVLSGTY